MEINFRHENKCFNFRVAAVIKNEDKILLANFNNIYTLPGGRVRFGETTDLAIKRKVLEELNVRVDIIKLLSINENFFEYGSDDYHELLFVYLCEIATPVDMEKVNEKEVRYAYVSFSDLLDLNFKPEFLLGELDALSGSIIHNVNK